MLKPRIELLKKEHCQHGFWRQGLWRCHDDYFISGYGDTPRKAYDDWRDKESRRSRVPRYGIWNRQDCVRWYNEGCRTIRSYIGSKQIVGYIPQTDELVLRG